jgi:hypothetical protein
VLPCTYREQLDAIRRRENPHHVVLVGLEQSGTEFIYGFLASEEMKHSNKVLGVVSIHPLALPFFWTVPLFVVLQSSSLLSGELRKCLTNPRFVTVVSPYSNAKYDYETPVLLRADPSAALWTIRLVAKYAEAAMSVYRDHYPSMALPRSRL